MAKRFEGIGLYGHALGTFSYADKVFDWRASSGDDVQKVQVLADLDYSSNGHDY